MNIGSIGGAMPTYSYGVSAKQPEQQQDQPEESLFGAKPEVDPMTGEEVCQTCKNRRYIDGSDDAGVSYQTATKISPQQAASRVMSHEMEHVTRNRAKAERDQREVVSQHVSIRRDICPECGKLYVSGGTTRTVTQDKFKEKYAIGSEEERGGFEAKV